MKDKYLVYVIFSTMKLNNMFVMKTRDNEGDKPAITTMKSNMQKQVDLDMVKNMDKYLISVEFLNVLFYGLTKFV